MNKANCNKGRSVLTLEITKRHLKLRDYGLEKIPTEGLLKIALETIGSQECYIEELEEKVRRYESNKALIKEIQREAVAEERKTRFVQNLEQRLSKQGETISKLYRSRSELAEEIVRLNKLLNVVK